MSSLDIEIKTIQKELLGMCNSQINPTPSRFGSINCYLIPGPIPVNTNTPTRVGSFKIPKEYMEKNGANIAFDFVLSFKNYTLNTLANFQLTVGNGFTNTSLNSSDNASDNFICNNFIQPKNNSISSYSGFLIRRDDRTIYSTINNNTFEGGTFNKDLEIDVFLSTNEGVITLEMGKLNIVGVPIIVN